MQKMHLEQRRSEPVPLVVLALTEPGLRQMQPPLLAEHPSVLLWVMLHDLDAGDGRWWTMDSLSVISAASVIVHS